MMHLKLIQALCKSEAIVVAAYLELDLKEVLTCIPVPQNPFAYPHNAPSFVPRCFDVKFKGLLIGKIPAWAIAFALSQIGGPMTYSLHKLVVKELCDALDHSFII